MNNIFFKVLKISAKKTFQDVRSKSPFFLPQGNGKAYITKKLWNHLHFEKDRPMTDLMQRLLIFPLFEDIFLLGEIVQQNSSFVRIEYTKNSITFCAICKQNGKEYIVLSYFIKNKKTPCLGL